MNLFLLFNFFLFLLLTCLPACSCYFGPRTLRKYPGFGWSRVSRNMDVNKIILGRDGYSWGGIKKSTVIFQMSYHKFTELFTLPHFSRPSDPNCKRFSLIQTGAKGNVENYRRISILPVITKIFEKEVHKQLYLYLVTNDLLHPCWHGFRPKRSTQTALIKVINEWLSNMDKVY